MTTTRQTVCLYPKSSVIGFLAAWVVRKALGEEHVTFRQMELNSDVGMPEIDDCNVIVIGLNFRNEIINQIMQRAHTLLILKQTLRGVTYGHVEECSWAVLQKRWKQERGIREDVRLITYGYDDVSIAMITWSYFLGAPTGAPSGLTAPGFLRDFVTDDGDAWLFKLEYYKESGWSITKLLHPYDFKGWDLLESEACTRESLLIRNANIWRSGEADLSYYTLAIGEARLISLPKEYFTLGGWRIPVARSPFRITKDVASRLAMDVPFSGIYWDSEIRSIQIFSSGLEMRAARLAYLYHDCKHVVDDDQFVIYKPIGWTGD